MIFEAGGLQLSGTDTFPRGATRATILALHGAGYSAGYWDHPLDPDASLLKLGPALGYRVVAIDRPGYGATYGLTGADVRMGRQAQVVLDLVDQLRRDPASGAGVFLIGHSMGAILVLHMLAAARRRAIAGADFSGMPYRFARPPDRAALERAGHQPALPGAIRRSLFYGPDGTFDPKVLEAEERIIRPIPAAEVIDAVECAEAGPALAARVTAPVQITWAEFDVSSSGSRATLQELGALFTISPRVDLVWQRGSGHNISLQRVARAYHLRAIAFFDEVLARG
jgi:pimeloyl-ACP methyl ester carboxylesterase